MTRKILIAHSDQKSLVILGDVLKEKGYDIFSAADGPRALEIAVSQGPDLLLLDVALPLIDGEKLTAILRANPRTEALPILFFAEDRSDVIALQSYHDGYLPKAVAADEVLKRVESIFGKEEKVKEVSVIAKEIEGSISQIPLVDLLQVLCMHKREGIVTVEREGERGYIDLRDGAMINARVGRVEGEKALFRLLSWQEGRFEFSPCTIESAAKISGTPDSLLIEGMRQIDEWERFKGSWPRPEATLRLRVDRAQLPQGLRPITQEILLLLEFYARVQDIVDNCPYPDYECFVTLQSLLEKGIVEVGGTGLEGTRDVVTPISTPEKILRLKEVFAVPGKSKLTRENIRVSVFTSGMAALRKFISRLSSLPILEPTDRLPDREGGDDSPFIGVVARLPLSDTVNLQFFSMPPGVDFLPLWRTFSAKSLGRVLVCDSSLTQRLADLQAVRSVTAGENGGKLIHVILPDDAGPTALESDLRTSLKVTKEEPVFILNPDDPNGAARLISELLERALP